MPNLSVDHTSSSHYLNTLSMISEMLEKNEYFSPENMDFLNFKNIKNIFQNNNLMNMNPINKNQMFPFNMGNVPPQKTNDKTVDNSEDLKFINQKSLTVPFKRAGTHVAIAYYIYVNKNKNKFNENKNNLECDPTYHARVLREKKNVN